jgi:hypothetical protein
VATSYEAAFESLRGVYLEDSWVLDVVPAEGSVTFELDAVLTPEHRAYRGPNPGEQHDYRHAQLVLSGDRMLVELADTPPATDAKGEADRGHIDTWTVDDEGTSRLTGDWGSAEVARAHVRLTLS